MFCAVIGDKELGVLSRLGPDVNCQRAHSCQGENPEAWVIHSSHSFASGNNVYRWLLQLLPDS